MQTGLFYFEGCPNYQAALEAVQLAFNACGVDESVTCICVLDDVDAVAKRFLGSPSIRIDGLDLEIQDETSISHSLCCRRYRDGDSVIGYPPPHMIVEAIQRARTAGECPK